MRVLAIGDIHGCLDAFDALLAAVAPTRTDWVVTLGDYVDRGPDSRGVLDRLIELSRGGRLVALRGNHEEMMLDARDDLGLLGAWLQYGGQDTLDSYGTAERAAGLDDVPEAHWTFLEQQCVDWFESEKHFFVHANADPKLHLPDQSPTMLRWAKFVDPPPHRSGKIMVCGHTCQESGWPRNLGHAVCIDTCIYDGGWLTCLDVGSGKFWQSNQAGEIRTGDLADYLEPALVKGKPIAGR
ncbi:MAG TPA: metallophosphoesterase family protein [Pirellulales bacterium]|jgi:serine/threonine protein phosphatase 1|nr:metallophosphoesterase family protein [Pirellulales bacterium]